MLNAILDFLFPPSELEIKIRSLSPLDFYNISPKAPQTEFPFIKSVFAYKDPLVRELVWQIKYKKNKHAIGIAGFSLHEELKKLNERAVLVPIPLSNKRRRERGYNQCELIIDEIIKLDKEGKFTKNYNILKRIEHRERQTDKNRQERIQNSENIFEIDQKIDLGAKIIIIDDVTTTGSTLKEARGALIKTGYSDVTALTIAH